MLYTLLELDKILTNLWWMGNTILNQVISLIITTAHPAFSHSVNVSS